MKNGDYLQCVMIDDLRSTLKIKSLLEFIILQILLQHNHDDINLHTSKLTQSLVLIHVGQNDHKRI